MTSMPVHLFQQVSAARSSEIELLKRRRGRAMGSSLSPLAQQSRESHEQLLGLQAYLQAGSEVLHPERRSNARPIPCCLQTGPLDPTPNCAAQSVFPQRPPKRLRGCPSEPVIQYDFRLLQIPTVPPRRWPSCPPLVVVQRAYQSERIPWGSQVSGVFSRV